VSIHLDEFEAIYGVSDNIGALRSKILDLAFQGKLTEQKSNEQNIEKFVERIEEEREKLIEEKSITKPRGGLESIESSNLEEELPENWGILKLGKVVYLLPSRKKKHGKHPYLLVKVLRKEKDPKMKEKGQIVEKGENVILVDGENSGEVFKVHTKGYLGSTLRRLKINSQINDEYLLLFLKKQHLFLKNRKKGAAIPHLNKTIFRNIDFPLPPLEEQKRIVKRIEELMSQVDELEDKVKTKEETSENLSYAVVDAINNSQNGVDLKDNLQLVIDNMNKIFNTPDSMEEMRNVVLQLAIEGKLVDQDPSDGFAIHIIQEIYKNNNMSFSRKKMKLVEKVKEPFDISDNWVWVKLKNIAEINPRNSLDNNLKVSFVPMKLIEEGYGSEYKYKTAKWEDVKSGYTHFAKNDIGIAKITPCFQNRKSVIFDQLKSGYGAGTTELHIIRPLTNKITKKYLLYVFKSKWFINEGVSAFSGTAGQQRISTKFIKNFPIPIPPYKEQKRIVEKVNSLMNIIGELETDLTKRYNLIKKLGAV